jgi:hypothetical protein
MKGGRVPEGGRDGKEGERKRREGGELGIREGGYGHSDI